MEEQYKIRASQLIVMLQAAIDQHGDRFVTMWPDSPDRVPREITPNLGDNDFALMCY